MEEKTAAGRLWMPCLTRSEVSQLFADVTELRLIRDELASSIRYWNDVQLLDPADPKLDPEGEIFFEAPNGYRLRLWSSRDETRVSAMTCRSAERIDDRA